jgi:hypothetical protein
MEGAGKVVKHVESVDELKRLCGKATTFYLALNYGLYSLKTIRWDGKVFHIHNHVDESRQKLTEAQLFTESNIGRGIEKKALIRHLRETEEE